MSKNHYFKITFESKKDRKKIFDKDIQSNLTPIIKLDKKTVVTKAEKYEDVDHEVNELITSYNDVEGNSIMDWEHINYEIKELDRID